MQSRCCRTYNEVSSFSLVKYTKEIPLAGGSFRGTTLVGGFFGGMISSDISGPSKILVF